MFGSVGLEQKLAAQEVVMVIHWHDVGFLVKMVNVRHAGAASNCTERLVLADL